MLSNNSITLVKARQPKQDDIALLEAIRIIEETQQKPDQTSRELVGKHKEELDCLIEALEQDGVSGFNAAKTALLNRNQQLSSLYSIHQQDQEQAAAAEEDKRFTTDAQGNKIIRLCSIEDIYQTPDADYLISRILEEAAVSLLYGLSGTGKTFTALHLALCVAHGEPWHRRRVKQGPVWYVNTEGARGLKKRLKAWFMTYPYYSEPSSNFKVIPWSLDLRENFSELQNTIAQEQQKPALIVLDNFSMCTPGVNQNLQEEIAPILRLINGLAQEYGCHVMIVHHTNKVGDFNGAMAFRNHVDTMIELRKEDRADKDSAILFTCQKSRDDEPFRDIKTELQRIVLSVNQDTGEDVTSCVVVESSEPIKPEGLKDTAQNILDLLGNNTYGSEEWKKIVNNELHISAATFERYKKELLSKHYIRKVRVEGKAYEQYCKVDTTSEGSSND